MLPLLKNRAPYNQVINMASFWIMSSAMAFMTFTLTFAGVVQTHLQRVLGEGFMDVQDQIAIFYWMRFGPASSSSSVRSSSSTRCSSRREEVIERSQAAPAE
ncbi:MAG: hypothetical protein R3D02_00455 [Hyphomicrobiales bacterium]